MAVFDIFRLGRLVPTRKQDNQFSTSFGIVNTAARTDVDLEFADPCSKPSVRPDSRVPADRFEPGYVLDPDGPLRALIQSR
jgi:hypothetical protein